MEGPLASSILGSLIDTVWFFTLAFAGTDLETTTYSLGWFNIDAPIWTGWAGGDFYVKLSVAFVPLAPFGLLRRLVPSREAAERDSACGGSLKSCFSDRRCHPRAILKSFT